MKNKWFIKIFLYFLICPFILWAVLRLLYFNENFINYPIIYWMLPTFFLILLTFFVGFKKSLFNHEIYLVILFSLVASNFESQIFMFCEEIKNSSNSITAFIITLNLVILACHLTWFWNTIKRSFLYLTFFICFHLLNVFFYEFSFYLFFDKLFIF